MEHFLTPVPGIILSVGGIASVAVVGVLYVMGLLKGKKNDADDRLIQILKTTVEELEKKVDEQGTEIEELTVKVSKLLKDNKRYIQILENRDEQSKEFYKQSFESIKLSKETHKLVVALVKGINDTNLQIERMIDLLSKHTEIVDHSIKK